ncbi:hypothetical protein ABZV96_27980 [Streptomyces misionensis]
MLIPILTAAENVGVPLRLRRSGTREHEERVESLLSPMELTVRRQGWPTGCWNSTTARS